MDQKEIEKHVAAATREISNLKEWRAGKDAGDAANRENQIEWNRRHERNLGEVFRRLSAVERKVIWISGVMAAVGSIAGHLLAGFLK